MLKSTKETDIQQQSPQPSALPTPWTSNPHLQPALVLSQSFLPHFCFTTKGKGWSLSDQGWCDRGRRVIGQLEVVVEGSLFLLQRETMQSWGLEVKGWWSHIVSRVFVSLQRFHKLPKHLSDKLKVKAPIWSFYFSCAEKQIWTSWEPFPIFCLHLLELVSDFYSEQHLWKLDQSASCPTGI